MNRALLVLIILAMATLGASRPVSYQPEFKTQKVLEAFGSPLAKMKVHGIPCSTWIHRRAKRWRVPQEILLTIIQKESSLVICGYPEKAQLRFSTCTGWACTSGEPLDPDNLGFVKQVDGAARTIRRWYDRYEAQGYPAAMIVEDLRSEKNRKNPYTFRDIVRGLVKIEKPRSIMDAVLITYTPHPGALHETKRVYAFLFKKQWGYE